MVPSTSFSDLPTEIRLKIWTLAVPDPPHPRLIAIYDAARKPSYITYKTNYRKTESVDEVLSIARSPLLAVNHEAREVALGKYELISMRDLGMDTSGVGPLPRVAVDFRRDMLYFALRPSFIKIDTYCVMYRTYRTLSLAQFTHQIQRIAIMASYWDFSCKLSDGFKRTIEAMTDLKEIYLVLEPSDFGGLMTSPGDPDEWGFYGGASSGLFDDSYRFLGFRRIYDIREFVSDLTAWISEVGRQIQVKLRADLDLDFACWFHEVPYVYRRRYPSPSGGFGHLLRAVW
jgi:hypothetical protein